MPRRINLIRETVAVFVVALFFPVLAHAEGVNVNAKVYDGQPGVFTITSPQDNAVVGTSPVTVEGTVHNIGQIMLYVDDAYSSTYPLDDGASTYSIQVSIGLGHHNLKLVGINPYDSSTIELTLKLTYAPGAQPQKPPIVKSVTDGAQNTNDYLKDQVQQASGTELATKLSDAMYNFMINTDILPVVSQGSVTVNLSRFALTATGLTAMVFPTLLYAGYRGLKMTVLSNVLPNIPMFASPRALLVTRLFGLITFLIPVIVLA